MTLDKAIEILATMGTPHFKGHTEDILAARQLGIAALNRTKSQRAGTTFPHSFLLPGETKD